MMRIIGYCVALLLIVINTPAQAASEVNLYLDAVKCSATSAMLLSVAEQAKKSPSSEQMRLEVQQYSKKSVDLMLERGHRLKKTDKQIKQDFDAMIKKSFGTTNEQTLQLLRSNSQYCVKSNIF